MKSRFRTLLILLPLLCAAAGNIAPAAHAQDVTASQPWDCIDCPTQEVIDRSTGTLKQKSSPGLPEQIQIMGRQMTGLMQYMSDAVVKDFTNWAMSFSQMLAGGLWLFFFLKVFRESGGKGDSLYWWFPRLGICLGLLLSSMTLVNDMVDIGKGVAIGPTANSSVFTFYDKMAANFTQSYALFSRSQFKVRVPGQSYPYAVKPLTGDDADTLYFGLLHDQQSTARSLNNNLNDSTWLMPRLYAWLGVCRGILEFADFVLMILFFITVMAAKLFAPFAVVMAVDREQAKRISYPFLYGVIVLTIVWPTVSYFIRGMAYLFGNVAMSLGDSAPAYVWNEATLQAFRNASSQPVYTVAFACFTMTISALALFFSPVIAYQISMGRLYEGVTNAVSTAAGMVTGLALEAATSIRSSLLSQDAARIQAQASFESETRRAGGERQAADFSVKGRQMSAEANIEGNRFSQLANAYANKGMQTGLFKAGRDFQNASLENQYLQNYRNSMVSRAKETADIRVAGKQQLAEQKYGAIASALEFTGRSVGPGVGLPLQHVGNIFGWKMRGDALVEATRERNQNLDNYHLNGFDMNGVHVPSLNESAVTFRNDMTKANSDFATAQIGAVSASTNQIVGGINHSSDVQLAGVRQEADKGLEANQTRYDAQTQAAGITRGAALEAARLHTEEQITRAIGSKLARDIENAMALRY